MFEHKLWTRLSGHLPCWQAPFPLLDLVQLLLALLEMNGQGLHILSSCTCWHHSARFTCIPRRHKTLLKNHWNPVQSEMLFAHSTAAFCSPQQHELASSAERITLVRDQSVITLLVGRLRGRRRNRLWSRKLWNVHLHRSFQRADVLDRGFNVLLLVPVGRPRH